MNFNTMLYRFCFDPNDFINEDRDPIRTADGFIYEVRQRTNIRICPECGSVSACIQDLYHYNRNDTFTESLRFIDYIS